MSAARRTTLAASRRRTAEWLGTVGGYVGLLPMARMLTARRLVRILCYHRVSDDARPLCTPVDLFDAQMTWACAHYRPVSLSDYVGNMTDRGHPPGDAFAVTFDDGYADILSYAMPILKRLGIPATVFVTTDYADGTRFPWWEEIADIVVGLASPEWQVRTVFGETVFPIRDRVTREVAFGYVCADLARMAPELRSEAIAELRRQAGLVSRAETAGGVMLDWDGVRALREEGAEVGCHGASHEPYDEEAPESVRADLSRAFDRMYAELGACSYALAFPYGDALPLGNQRSDLAEELGFYAAFTHRSPLARHNKDTFAMGRMGVQSERCTHFAAKLSGLTHLLKGRW